RKGFPDAWQLPQGGVDEGENIRLAVLRELKEEIGTDKAEIIAEYPDWLLYDLPPHLVGVAWNGKYRGQRQRWFALRFTGEDSDINLHADAHPEFEDWKWARLDELPHLAVAFKRDIYERLAREFAPYA
ncbi:MAG: RNA pyrophosphohydrolase, partial [Rhodospirillales bacterium]|nr:RNA pyrophosphohydrolase [Rhodospirillales bacterium]